MLGLNLAQWWRGKERTERLEGLHGRGKYIQDSHGWAGTTLMTGDVGGVEGGRERRYSVDACKSFKALITSALF